VRKVLLAGVAVVALMSNAASATDLPAADKRPVHRPSTGFLDPSPAYNWAGFYVGFNAGWGSAAYAAQTFTPTPTTPASWSLSQGGTLLGGVVGYNWQAGNIVAGIEGDWAWTLINDTGSGCVNSCYTTVNSLGTVRGRVGYSWSIFMPYLTGGFAWGHIEAGQPGVVSSSWQPGFTVGGGIEALFAPNWSVKAEYLMVRLNDSSYTATTPVTVTERNILIMRAGINHHFNKTYKVPGLATAPATVRQWDGVYVGANGGWGVSAAGHAISNFPVDDHFNKFDQSGALLGITFGLNRQISHMVYGVEADWGWANINGTGSGDAFSGCQAGCYTNVSSLGTVRGRVGYAWGTYMPYLTGGIAWAQIKSGQPGVDSGTWEPGFTLGGGIEALFAPNWSLKTEYLWVRVNDSGYTATAPVMVVQRDINVLRMGINYHFDLRPIAALY
jgi:outer membrane immunogenic protein